MTADGALLATDIGSAVRGLQFQDRISQRIAHVVSDLDTSSVHASKCMLCMRPRRCGSR